MNDRIRRGLFLAAGLTSLALGLIGAVLPVLPTTPFVLLAAFCFSRSSPWLHARLLRSPLLGPMIANWALHGAIAPRAKLAATAMIVPLCGYTVLFVPVPLLIIGIVLALCGSVLLFIWSRPAGPRQVAAERMSAGVAPVAARAGT